MRMSQKWSNNGGGSSKQLATSQQQYNSKQYDRIRVLGKGSFGTAVVHRRLADHSLVVLKEIDLQRFKGERERSSAIQEARIMSTLSHINIIKYHNAYTTDTKLIIEMEYASMGTLATYLACQMDLLEEQEILIIFRQIVSGLAYLHSKNIIHLDLKMSNIFVTIDGLVKIGDFGIAQYMESADNSNLNTSTEANQLNTTTINKRLESDKKQQQQTSSHLGTLAYSSPERCLSQQTDFKSDIWSLGCILYELITSRPLFVGTSLPELLLNIIRIQYQPIKRNISSPLRETFEQTIARHPLERPSAEDLLSITDQLLSRLQLMRYRLQSKRQSGQQRLDLSTEVALLAHKQQDDMMGHQINYLHSLIYQVRLDAHHIQVERVNLPPTKRIKEMSKGESHYLVLTYDNIVYGWGSKSCGQLGACGLSSVNRLRSARSSSVAGSGSTAKLDQHHQRDSPTSSLASSTQTIAGMATNKCSSQSQSTSTSNQHLSKQLVMSMLEESQPTSRPFIINELNHRKIIQVAAGNNFSVFLSKTGIVMTCGDGSSGCLGRGDLRSCFTPCMVESLLNSDVVSISCGPEHVVVVCGNGRAFGWERPKYVLRPQAIQFPDDVFIRSVFCGDRSTIFIDDQSRCWASGENRFNKLGLDLKRRFKKTQIVNKSPRPTLISHLIKYKIITCNIGKNHTTFLTSEGKLIVCGQDIDHGYRLRSNIISGRESHRRISFQLKTQRRLLYHLNPPQPPPPPPPPLHVTQPSSSHLSSSSQSRQFGSSRRRRKQIESYVKKSRASKKMPFECVISVSCRPKFTLALTNDNRVYFWGTRSHRQTTEFRNLAPAKSLTTRPPQQSPTGRSIEPQLISSTTDECFIKIAGTNNSLMTSIQLLGSDQPIIQAQDPRLMAKSLADLWILDYKPSLSYCSKSSDSERSSSSNDSHSCCSLSSLSICSCCSYQEEQENLKHDAILEPQPIVSLYVPNMFNTHNNGYSLHMVDLFCFDEDKFYLILDTTIKWHQHGAGGGHSNSSRSTTSTLVSSGSQQAQLRKRPASSPVDIKINAQDRELRDGHNQNQAPSDLHLVNNQLLDELKCDWEPSPSSCEQNFESEVEVKKNFNLRLEEDREKSSLALNSSSDDINNNHNTAISISKGGVSLYEPRSLSTFAASLSNHIIVGPTMRLDQEQPLKPLMFNDDNNLENDLEQQDLELQSSGGTLDDGLIHRNLNPLGCCQTVMATSADENSMTNSMTNNDIETSSMPSWVRNEFIQCQQQQEAIFNIESSDFINNNGDADDNETMNDEELLTEDEDDLSNNSNVNTFVHDRLVQNSPLVSLLYDRDCQAINLAQIELRNDYDKEVSTSKVGLFSSRSQPDISDLDAISRKQTPSSAAITRRASIIDELQEVEMRTSASANPNLLQCDVYRNCQLSSQLNLNSTLSSRSNSNSPLINWPSSVMNTNNQHQQQPRLMVEMGQDKPFINGSSYLWQELNARSHQNQHFRSGEGFGDGSLNGDANHHHHHRYSSINLPTAGKSKTGSSSSLASLRKSLIKLFC